jgi:hypothetical protein
MNALHFDTFSISSLSPFDLPELQCSKNPVEKMILATNRILTSSRMVWIPDPPIQQCLKLKRVFRKETLKFQPFLRGCWHIEEK